MGRQFNGTNQALQSAAALAALAEKRNIAIGAWISSDFAGDDDMLWELGANSNEVDGTFRTVISASGGSPLPVATINGAPSNAGNTSVAANGNPSAATWHYFLVNFNLSNDGSGGIYEVESIWLDGVDVTGSNLGAPNNTGALTSQVLNLMSRNGTALFADGMLADVTIWDTLIGGPLSGPDVANLYSGTRGRFVRQTDVLYYWPISGETSPEPALVGGVALNLIGAPTLVADPPALGPVEPPPEPLEFTVTRVDNQTALLTWDDADVSVPDGIVIWRAPGDQTTTLDGAGKAPGESGYDPRTIPSAELVADLVTDSPYTDDTGVEGDYTWWINRAEIVV
jgi:hypothetical protein